MGQQSLVTTLKAWESSNEEIHESHETTLKTFRVSSCPFVDRSLLRLSGLLQWHAEFKLRT